MPSGGRRRSALWCFPRPNSLPQLMGWSSETTYHQHRGEYMANPKENNNRGLIPPHGGYRDLKSFQMSEIVYDATVKFCDRFIDPRSRTHDQMVQAARSGNKNISEGSQVSGTSKKMELKLVGVARASLEELLGDY